MPAVAGALEANPKAVLFNAAGAGGHALVGNALASRSRFARAFGVTPQKLLPEILRRLHSLPETALFTPDEAAIYLNARLDLLRSWRWQGRGPDFAGRSHFIRYPKGGLDRFLAGYGRGAAA